MTRGYITFPLKTYGDRFLLLQSPCQGIGEGAVGQRYHLSIYGRRRPDSTICRASQGEITAETIGFPHLCYFTLGIPRVPLICICIYVYIIYIYIYILCACVRAMMFVCVSVNVCVCVESPESKGISRGPGTHDCLSWPTKTGQLGVKTCLQISDFGYGQVAKP